MNNNGFGVGRKQKKIFRAMIHNYEKSPLDDLTKEKLKKHIIGWLSFLNSVDKKGLNQLKNYWNRYSIEEAAPSKDV